MISLPKPEFKEALFGATISIEQHFPQVDLGHMVSGPEDLHCSEHPSQGSIGYYALILLTLDIVQDILFSLQKHLLVPTKGLA